MKCILGKALYHTPWRDRNRVSIFVSWPLEHQFLSEFLLELYVDLCLSVRINRSDFFSLLTPYMEMIAVGV